MKHLFIILALWLALSGIAAAQFNPPAALEQGGYGRLTVFSDIQGSDIYVDAKYVGQDRATISNIPSGKHYVRVVKGTDTIQSGIVNVRDGEETIIVAKPAGDRLLESMRKPNYVLLFGSMTSVSYNVSPSVTIGGRSFSSLEHRPQFGLGTEVKFAVPYVDVYVDLGFFINYPSVILIPSPEGSSYVYNEGQLAVSSPYLCVSKEIFKFPVFRLSAGGGLNYALYTPGSDTQVGVNSRLGYMAYLEFARLMENNQRLVLKTGYVNYAGKAGASSDISSPGYFIQGGMAYQL
jgi:hypothetical protein